MSGDRRYQIFVSSTFRDLLEERQAALQAILEMGHIPSGMEIFPAASETPWELIAKIIDDCDYYVVIVGGKYGSIEQDGVSYTEKEYDLAQERGKPTLGFLRRDLEELPIRVSEMDPETRKRLEAFRDKVALKHCKYWAAAQDLKSDLIIGLSYLMRTRPATGWVRGGAASPEKLYEEIAALQRRISELESENKRLTEAKDDALEAGEQSAILDRSMDVPFTCHSGPVHAVALTYREIFFAIGGKLVDGAIEREIERDLCELLLERLFNTKMWFELKLDTREGNITDAARQSIAVERQFVKRLVLDLLAANLVERVELQRAVIALNAGLSAVSESR